MDELEQMSHGFTNHQSLTTRQYSFKLDATASKAGQG